MSYGRPEDPAETAKWEAEKARSVAPADVAAWIEAHLHDGTLPAWQRRLLNRLYAGPAGAVIVSIAGSQPTYGELTIEADQIIWPLTDRPVQARKSWRVEVEMDADDVWARMRTHDTVPLTIRRANGDVLVGNAACAAIAASDQHITATWLGTGPLYPLPLLDGEPT